MQNIKEGFGANLRKIRKSRKLTIFALAEMSDITSRLLSKIEAGDTFLSTETLCKISVALDVSLQVLFDFEWHDKIIYYDENKYVKHHFKVMCSGGVTRIKSLPALSNFKINETIPQDKLPSYLIEFAKHNNMIIYAEFFVNSKREKIYKVTPNDSFLCVASDEQVNQPQDNIKDKNYYLALEKIKELSIYKKKIDYIITAADALTCKKSREKLKIMIETIDMLK